MTPKIIRKCENQDAIHEILSSEQTGGVLSLSRLHFLNGQSEQQPLPHYSDHWLFIENGQFNFQLGADSFSLKEHDLFFAPRGTAYSYLCGSFEGDLLQGVINTKTGETAAGLLPQAIRKNQVECMQAFGDVVWAILQSSTTNNRFCVAVTQAPSLGGPPLHLHTREDEAFVILSGRYEFQIGDARVQVEAGDVVWAPCQTAHTFRVVSSTPGQFLVIATPGGFDNFFRDCAELFESGGANPETIGAIGAQHGISFIPG